MSVLNALKGKIVNVQQDISESLRSLTRVNSRSKSATDSETADFGSGASYELLSRCQKSWTQLHQNSEDLADRAQSVDNQIASLFQYLDQQDAALGQFAAEMSNLVQLVVDVNIAKDKILSLDGAFGELESSLVELEDLCEQRKHLKIKQDHEQELKRYRQGKTNELEQVKAELARGHAAMVQKHEEQLSATLRERQKVFDEAHREQMIKYIATGQVDYLPASPVHISDLADIDLDQDQNELDQFLSSIEAIDPQSNETGRGDETDDELDDEFQAHHVLVGEDCNDASQLKPRTSPGVDTIAVLNAASDVVCS